MSSEPDSQIVSPRTDRRLDDVTRFVTRFRELTGFSVNSTSAEGLPREFLAKPAPRPDDLVYRFAYELEPRTRNTLQRYEPSRWPNAPWTFGRLLEIRGFGVFSLLDVLELMAKHPTEEWTSSPKTS